VTTYVCESCKSLVLKLGFLVLRQYAASILLCFACVITRELFIYLLGQRTDIVISKIHIS